MLFINNILRSYENYLIKSYIGVEGRISIKTKDEKLIDNTALWAKKNHYLFSKKEIIKTNIIFKSQNKNILKYVKFIILDKDYLKNKFHISLKNNTLFANQVFFNSLGSLNIKEFNKICTKTNKCFNIDTIKQVDTGFIENSPIIFITHNFAFKIFKIKPTIYYLEFMKVNKEKLKNFLKKEALKLKTMEYKIKDLLTDTKSTRELFRKINIIEIGILIIFAIFSIGIILLSVKIAIEFKRNSLKILHLLGMSGFELSFTLSLILFLITIIISILSLMIIPLYQHIFLTITHFNKNFFIPINMDNLIYLFIFSLFLFFLVFISSYKTFKGK